MKKYKKPVLIINLLFEDFMMASVEDDDVVYDMDNWEEQV